MQKQCNEFCSQRLSYGICKFYSLQLLSTSMQFLFFQFESIKVLLYLYFRLKNSERIFIHKSLLVSLGVGNLLYVLDISSFTTREKNTVSKVKIHPLREIIS